MNWSAGLVFLSQLIHQTSKTMKLQSWRVAAWWGKGWQDFSLIYIFSTLHVP